MDYSYIKQLLEDNPAIKVLRAKTAPLILGFFFEAFKKNQRTTIPNEELVIVLGSYLEDIDQTQESEGDAQERARQLLDDWSSDTNRYIRKYPDANGVIVNELSGYIEKVFRWFELLKPAEYVGTESRFSDILRRLTELVEGATEDPEQKINDLMKKKQEIEAEIEEIRISGEVKSYSDWQIKERFEELSRNARDLLADFKDIEQNFKKIVEHIYREEVENNPTRGHILEYTLDANNELKRSPQGKSFEAFWNFLIADAGDDRINALVSKVYDLLKKNSLSYEDQFLKKLKYHLHLAGKRVIESNHILADKLNRVLSEGSQIQRHRIKELIREIKQIVFSVKERPPEKERYMWIMGNPVVRLQFERPLTLPEEKSINTSMPSADTEADPDILFPLFDLFYVDKKKLNANIRQSLAEHSEVTLAEILEKYPVEKGIAEIVVYYDIASTSKRARIVDDRFFFILYDYKNTVKRIKAPEVIFFR